MKILYATSEAAPFAKSGGLADVAGALPKALVRDGIDCRVVMPLYNDLTFKDTLTYVTNFSVPVGWRSQYCGLFRAVHDGGYLLFPGQTNIISSAAGCTASMMTASVSPSSPAQSSKCCSTPILNPTSSTATTGDRADPGVSEPVLSSS